MSKLYDVINRLEEIAEKDAQETMAADIPFQPAKAEKRSPWLRVIILSSVLIFAGIVVLAVTAWLQNWFPGQETRLPIQETLSAPAVETSLEEQPLLDSAGEAPSLAVTPAEQSQPIAQPTPARSVRNTELRLEKTKQQQTVPGNSAPTPLPAPTSPDELPPPQKEQDKVVIEPQPLTISPSPPKSQRQEKVDNTFKIKQWLYQAEQLRKTKRWEAAIVLYGRIWDISKEVGVANNYAASLLQLQRPVEALAILDQALTKAPQDRDLRANREVALQMLGE